MARNKMPVRPPAKLYFHSPSVNRQDHPDYNDGGRDAHQALGGDLDTPDADFEFMHGAALLKKPERVLFWGDKECVVVPISNCKGRNLSLHHAIPGFPANSASAKLDSRTNGNQLLKSAQTLTPPDSAQSRG
jgi:hypothetical protein